MVEGPGLVGQAFESGWEIEGLYLAAEASRDGIPLPSGLLDGRVPLHDFAPEVMGRVATTETPPAVLAVVHRRTAQPADVADATFVLVGDRVSDPGNAGTMLRSAEAAGADAIAFTSGSVDVFNPKVIRSSAGALFTVPVIVELPLDDVLAGTARRSWGTTSHADRVDAVPYLDADLTGPTTLVLGNEAHGLPDDTPVDAWLTIPHVGRSESLNVAMAATVLAFEVARQRRTAGAPGASGSSPADRAR